MTAGPCLGFIVVEVMKACSVKHVTYTIPSVLNMGLKVYSESDSENRDIFMSFLMKRGVV